MRGYLVGPGSEVEGKSYYVLDGREPATAPAWLLDLVGKERASSTLVNGDLVVNERERIALGENDTELFSLGCNFRRRGFTEEAIKTFLRAVLDSGLVEQIPGNEYSERDIQRLARQAARYDPDLGELSFVEDEWISAADISLVGPPIDWWVRGYIPRGELVTLYGDGGIGKSSWASWLASNVTGKGGKFVFVGIEEPFTRFAARAVLGGADRSRLFAIPNAHALVLPKDCEDLKKQVILAEADVLYFDSIYSHFNSVPGENAAERARKALAPLASLAISTGCTVIAVFHKGKSGSYLGSTEMLNVARYALEADRKHNGPLKLWVAKTNLYDPGDAMTFKAEDAEIRDPESGQVQYEVLEDGELAPMKIKVLTRIENTSSYAEEERGDSEAERFQAILKILKEDPEASANFIYKMVGGRKADVLEQVKALKGEVVPTE